MHVHVMTTPLLYVPCSMHASRGQQGANRERRWDPPTVDSGQLDHTPCRHAELQYGGGQWSHLVSKLQQELGTGEAGMVPSGGREDYYLLVVMCTLSSPQGVVGSTSGSAWYINWEEPSKLKLIGGHSGEISAVAFSAGDPSPFLASSSLDGSLAMWRADTREQMVLFRAPNKACHCVAFSLTPQPHPAPKGKSPPLPSLMAGYSDGTVRVFDVEAGKMLKKVQPHAKPVKAVAYFDHG